MGLMFIVEWAFGHYSFIRSYEFPLDIQQRKTDRSKEKKLGYDCKDIEESRREEGTEK